MSKRSKFHRKPVWAAARSFTSALPSAPDALADARPMAFCCAMLRTFCTKACSGMER